MNQKSHIFSFMAVCLLLLLNVSTHAQTTFADLTATNDNHKLLAAITGVWSFEGKHIFAGPTPRSFNFGGSFTRKEVYEGRYFIAEITGGEIKMPWSAGKPVLYHEMALEGYDNVKRKFVSANVNNESETGIIMMEGDYDPATKTITYDGESISHLHKEIPEGTKMHFHSMLKFIDQNHFSLEWHELVNGSEIVRTDLVFTRKTL